MSQELGAVLGPCFLISVQHSRLLHLSFCTQGAGCHIFSYLEHRWGGSRLWPCRQGGGGRVNFLDISGPGPGLSVPWPVSMVVVKSPSHPSWLLSAGTWESAISYCELAPNKSFLLPNSSPNVQLFPGASKPQVPFSSQMDFGLFSQHLRDFI